MNARTTVTPDTEISPIEARNEGHGRKGSSSQETPIEPGEGDGEGRGEKAREPIRKGGEVESRDDL